MARAPDRKIPAAVLSKARRVALATQEHPALPSPMKKRAPLASESAKPGTREKVIAALRRLHPMD